MRRGLRSPAAPAGGAILEVELKLALPPGQAERLKRHASLRPISPHRAVVAELDAIYYDTPGLALQSRGIAVRLRQAHGRWVQTVKTGGRTAGALHSRLEWETPSDGLGLDFSVIDDAALRRMLEDPALRSALQPVFRTRFRRWARLLRLADGAEIELALDQGVIEAGDQSAPISEIELELKSGRPEQLFGLAMALLPEIALHPEPRSKAERGYALHSALPARAAHASVPAIEARLSPREACARFVSAALEQIQRNLEGACAAAEPEFLHQARVGLRRLRALLGVFRRAVPECGHAPLREGLRWLMGEVGPARDWDVLCSDTLVQVATSFPDHAGLAALARLAEEARVGAQAQARQALQSERVTLLLLEAGRLACQLAAPAPASAPVTVGTVESFGRSLLRKRAARAILSRTALAGLDVEALHAWRIELKKLRYTGDFLLPVLGHRERARRWIAALSSLQDILGRLNDTATTHRLLASLPLATPDVREAAALVRGHVEGACQIRLAQLEQARKRLERAAAPW